VCYFLSLCGDLNAIVLFLCPTGEDMDEYRGLNGIYMGTYQGRQLGINYMPSRWHKVHPDWSDPWVTKYPSMDTQSINKKD